MNEIWKDIPGFEGHYQVSNLGKVRARKYIMINGCLEIVPGKILSQTKSRGYPYTGVQLNNKRRSFSVHRLVAICFIPNPKSLPEVNHIDGIKTNNKITNLEWVTSSENKKHAFRLGLMKPTRGELCGKHKITEKQVREIRQMRKEGFLHKDIAKHFCLGQSTVTHILLGTRWAHVKK